MAPGTRNAPQENYTVAVASGVAYCSRSQITPTRSESAAAPDLRAVCTLEQGE